MALTNAWMRCGVVSRASRANARGDNPRVSQRAAAQTSEAGITMGFLARAAADRAEGSMMNFPSRARATVRIDR
jgi:hypothetical protein